MAADFRSLRRRHAELTDPMGVNTLNPMASPLARLGRDTRGDLSMLGERARNSPSIKSLGSQDATSLPPVYGPSVFRHVDDPTRTSHKRGFMSPFVNRTAPRRNNGPGAMPSLQPHATEDSLSASSAPPNLEPLTRPTHEKVMTASRGPRDARSKSPDQRGAAKREKRVEPTNTLFVWNLSFDANVHSLYKTFSACGTVLDVRIPTEKDSGRMKGFGYVAFDSTKQARHAHSLMQGFPFNGHPMRLNFVQPRVRCDYCYEFGHVQADCFMLAPQTNLSGHGPRYDNGEDGQEATTQSEPLTQMFMHYTLSEDHCGGNDVIKGNILARLGARSEESCFQDRLHSELESSSRSRTPKKDLEAPISYGSASSESHVDIA